MPKNIPPVHGIPFPEVVEPIRRFLAPLPDTDLRKLVLEIINDGVNLDTCLKPGQATYAEGLIRRRLGLQLNEPSTSVDQGVVGIITIINSFRLECQHCSNSSCPQRDPALKDPNA